MIWRSTVGGLRPGWRGYPIKMMRSDRWAVVRWAVVLAPLSPMPGEAAPPGMVRAEVGACILEAPADLRVLLERLAAQAAEVLPRVETELGARAVAPYRIVVIPRVLAPPVLELHD